MKEIPLSNGGVALVDDEDYERVVAMGNWRLARRKWPYACRDEKGHRIWMHRFVMGNQDGVLYDHINGNGLDNRKSNLRPVTHQQNMWNRRRHRMPRERSSVYAGVTWKKSHKKWCVMIWMDGRQKHIGLYQDEVAAARAYDDAARSIRGEFARVNFPLDGEQPAHAQDSSAVGRL